MVSVFNLSVEFNLASVFNLSSHRICKVFEFYMNKWLLKAKDLLGRWIGVVYLCSFRFLQIHLAMRPNMHRTNTINRTNITIRLVGSFCDSERNTPRLTMWIIRKSAAYKKLLHLLLYITRKYTIINTYLKLINAKTRPRLKV